MNHPFNLSLSELELLDLDFEEDTVPDQVVGGLSIATKIYGEGGHPYPIPIKPFPPRCPLPKPRPHPIVPGPKPPIEVTTLALGEEGGYCFD